MKQVLLANQKNLKAIPSGGTIGYRYVHGLVVLGNHHDPMIKPYIDRMAKESTYCTGRIEVLRTAIVGKGDLKVTPPKGSRTEFETLMRQITPKKVFFV